MTGNPQDHLTSSSSPAEQEEPLVVLEFPSFQEFLETCSSRIGGEGLFLEVEPRERVGSQLQFELRIRDGFRLLRGEGEVIGVHDPLPTSGEAAGLTVRFVELDEASEKLLPVILNHYHAAGVPLLQAIAAGSPVEVEVVDSDATDPRAAKVSLDDLWEEFEVGNQQPSGEASHDGSPAIGAAPHLVPAEELAPGFDREPDGEEASVAAESDVPAEEKSVAPLGDETLPAAPEVDTSDDLQTFDEEPLDLSAVLPAPHGGSDLSAAMLELPPDELSGPEDSRSRPWWRRRELWLLLLMAALGALVGLVVYLRYVNGGQWPWSPSLDQGRHETEGTRVTDEPPAAAERDIIARFDFEDPSKDLRAADQPRSDDGAPEAMAPKMDRRQVKPQRVKADKKPANSRSGTTRPESEPVGVLTGVDRITWEEVQDQTVLTLWGDGPFDSDKLVVFRLDTGTPRQVVKILGVSRPFMQPNLEIGTSHVSAVRTGLHAGKVGQELHVVADLEDPGVRMRRVEPEGSQLHVYFSRL